jgi:hypothetical protein
MTALDMRVNRADDELDKDSPQGFESTLPAQRAQVLANPWQTIPALEMLTPYHVKDQTFKITPGWCVYTEFTLDGVRLRDMAPQQWEPGTLLYAECTLRWDVSRGSRNGAGVFYKNGAFSVLSAIIRTSRESLVISEGPPDSAADQGTVEQDSIRRFRIGTIGEKKVVPTPTGPIFLSSFSSAFDIGRMALL